MASMSVRVLASSTAGTDGTATMSIAAWIMSVTLATWAAISAAVSPETMMPWLRSSVIFGAGLPVRAVYASRTAAIPRASGTPGSM